MYFLPKHADGHLRLILGSLVPLASSISNLFKKTSVASLNLCNRKILVYNTKCLLKTSVYHNLYPQTGSILILTTNRDQPDA